MRKTCVRWVAGTFQLAALAWAIGCASTDAPDDGAEELSRVYVMGMIHGEHRASQRYGVDVIREAIVRIEPDYVLCEIPPDRLAPTLAGYERTGIIADPRIRVFPEYTEVLIPLARDMDFKIIPCSAWTQEMADARREKLSRWRTDRPEATERSTMAMRETAAAIDREGGADDPAFIHTDRYDELVRVGMEPYSRLFGPDLGASGWEQINAAHWSLIEAALDAHAGEGATFLVMFGAWHKHWILDRLVERADVTISSPFPETD